MKILGRSKRVIHLKVEGRLAIGAVPSLHTLVGEVAVNRPVVVLVCMAGVTDMDLTGWVSSLSRSQCSNVKADGWR